MTNKKHWPIVKFGDVVRQVKDKVDVESSGLDRYVAGEHMETDDLRIRSWGTIDDGYLGPAFHMRFKPGQVLYGSRRTYLRKVAVPDFEGICANTTFVLEPKDSTVLLPELLPFIMQTESFHDHSIKQSKGSVNPYVNFSDLAWYEFALPPMEEQRRIAEVLGKVDAFSSLLEETLVSHKKVAEALFIELVNRESSSKAVRLADLCELITDGDHNPPKRQQNGIPHLVVNNIIDGRITDNNCTYISQQDYERVCKRYTPSGGDIIVTCVGTIGRIALVPDGYAFSADRSLAICRPHRDILLPEFAAWLLTTKEAQYELQRFTLGTAQLHLYLSDLRRVRVRVPSVSAQRRHLDELEKIDSAQCNILQRLTNLQMLRQRVIHYQIDSHGE